MILTAEEIVSSDLVLSDPNRILLPPQKVTAVCHVPGGAYPSPVQGYYGRDHAAFSEYHQATRERTGFLKWLEQLDAEREAIAARAQERRPKQSRLAATVDYA